ncbi:hypothetical protein ACBR38_19795 [Streptomyces sp. MAD19A]|uniref:hypothetical protein n=1 Tax=Streptomyces sp. MAD19A TaxID=3242896 RepID=UPI003526DAC2
MGPNPEKVRRTLELLATLTRKGRIEWEKYRSPRRRITTSVTARGNSERFSTSLADATVHVYSKDDDGHHPYIVEIYDDSGELTLHVSSEFGEGAIFTAIENLYETVYESATNIDPFLDSLIQQLEAEDE